MPGKKNDSKAPADPSTQDKSAGASAVPENENAPIDLMGALSVGNPDLEPLGVTFHGIDFSIRRWYPPEEVWELSDLQREQIPVPALDANASPEDVRAAEEKVKMLLVANLVAQLKYLVVPEDHPQIAELIVKWENRTNGELNRIVRYLYQLAGITSPQGEFLAS